MTNKTKKQMNKAEMKKAKGGRGGRFGAACRRLGAFDGTEDEGM